MAPKKHREYEIQMDTLGHFSPGQVITGLDYKAVKEEYEVRLKEWVGGETTIHLSGRKRDAIKSFLEEKRYVLTPEYYHYCVRARGKSVDPVAISQKAGDLGLKFLWTRIAGEPPESDPGMLRRR